MADDEHNRDQGPHQQETHAHEVGPRPSQRDRQRRESRFPVSITVGNAIGEVDHGRKRTAAEEQDLQCARRTAGDQPDPEGHQRKRDHKGQKAERLAFEPEIVPPAASDPHTDQQQWDRTQPGDRAEQEGADGAHDGHIQRRARRDQAQGNRSPACGPPVEVGIRPVI